MSKKNEEDKKDKRKLKEETVEAVSAIIFILVAIILLLASFGKAGMVGEKIFLFFKFLFGSGYYLLPLILLMLGFSFLREIKTNFAIPKIIGGIILFLSGLGLSELLFKSGGVIGILISKPLIGLFEVWVTGIGLLALVIISILLIFEAKLKLPEINWFKKKNPEENADKKMDILVNGVEQKEDGKNEPKIQGVVSEEQNKTNNDKKTKEDDEIGFMGFTRRKKSHQTYVPPPLTLLEKDSGRPDVGDIKANANIIRRTLLSFGIQVEMDEVSVGPSVTRYALKPAEGIKLSRIVTLKNDLSLALAAHPLRIEAPIPGKSLVGIEMPNTVKSIVGLGSLLKSEDFTKSDKSLLVALGKSVTGLSYFSDISRMPHLLIAGATGSGKSVTIHAMITSLLYRNSPEALKFIMIDPKRVELTLYNKIPHLLTPVITNAKKTIMALKWAAKEMDRRYDILEQSSVQNVSSYHKNIVDKWSGSEEDAPDPMPYIVIVIDELADIMQAYPRELEACIVRLAQMSRAVGIHLVLSTQRPSVNVITGLIKANIPTRIALQVSSQIDSRTILDMSGAENLLGAGDMLYLSGDMAQPRRLQSAFITEKEVKRVVAYLIDSYKNELPEVGIELGENGNKTPDLFTDQIDMNEFGGGGEGDDDDSMYEEARRAVVEVGKASTSYLQRKLRIGYSRAARLMDILENRGVIGPADGARPREILVKSNSSEEVSGENTGSDNLNYPEKINFNEEEKENFEIGPEKSEDSLSEREKDDSTN